MTEVETYAQVAERTPTVETPLTRGKGKDLQKIAPEYRRLKPVYRRFVDGILAGEKGCHIVHRLRPELKRPDLLVTKWLKRDDVRAALSERADVAATLPDTLARIDARLDAIESLLRRLVAE